jgi:hypothetical protein
MRQRSEDDYEQAYVIYVHSYYAKNKRLPEYGALPNYRMKVTTNDLRMMTMHIGAEIACEITRTFGESALYYSIHDTEFGEDITETDPKHRSTKGYIVCNAVAKLRDELFPEGHRGLSAQWSYPGTRQVMGTISREYLDWLYFQGVLLLDLDIHSAQDILIGIPRTTGMRIDGSEEVDFGKPKNRTGETYVDSDDEDSGTTYNPDNRLCKTTRRSIQYCRLRLLSS